MMVCVITGSRCSYEDDGNHDSTSNRSAIQGMAISVEMRDDNDRPLYNRPYVDHIRVEGSFVDCTTVVVLTQPDTSCYFRVSIVNPNNVAGSKRHRAFRLYVNDGERRIQRNISLIIAPGRDYRLLCLAVVRCYQGRLWDGDDLEELTEPVVLPKGGYYKYTSTKCQINANICPFHSGTWKLDELPTWSDKIFWDYHSTYWPPSRYLLRNRRGVEGMTVSLDMKDDRPIQNIPYVDDGDIYRITCIATIVLTQAETSCFFSLSIWDPSKNVTKNEARLRKYVRDNRNEVHRTRYVRLKIDPDSNSKVKCYAVLNCWFGRVRDRRKGRDTTLQTAFLERQHTKGIPIPPMNYPISISSAYHNLSAPMKYNALQLQRYDSQYLSLSYRTLPKQHLDQSIEQRNGVRPNCIGPTTTIGDAYSKNFRFRFGGRYHFTTEHTSTNFNVKSSTGYIVYPQNYYQRCSEENDVDLDEFCLLHNMFDVLEEILMWFEFSVLDDIAEMDRVRRKFTGRVDELLSSAVPFAHRDYVFNFYRELPGLTAVGMKKRRNSSITITNFRLTQHRNGQADFVGCTLSNWKDWVALINPIYEIFSHGSHLYGTTHMKAFKGHRSITSFFYQMLTEGNVVSITIQNASEHGSQVLNHTSEVDEFFVSTVTFQMESSTTSTTGQTSITKRQGSFHAIWQYRCNGLYDGATIDAKSDWMITQSLFCYENAQQFAVPEDRD